ncbi:glycoside hydrolase family 27 protein [Heterobasidion irregulare TC 32-1]|uniref:Alpha-galactosidase n=1 Tax=Heterobasidion irregulare (strain TC 32-1) TaxID=747525 RepID=W4JXV1_HETIT|nr:glycoside hydrolase family 27 protein [Heterobasidion irregulare TC 32-1]ETW77716.1 glycoside hydrolase family 27 protein [Heterobasidion irregulare TC 32-1]
MSVFISTSSLLLVLGLVPGIVSLDNGLSRTPAMAFNGYNAFACDGTEDQYRSMAKNLVDLGLFALGYDTLGIDCGWQAKNRTSDGKFAWDTTRFPSGIPALSSYVHDLGLKFGLYSDAGYYACDFVGGSAHFIGSLGHEVDDANSFAEWGADYLKYDNCYAVSATDFVDYNPSFSLQPHYTAMRDALNATGRPIVYSVCEWGVQDPARWAAPVGNSWRISNDIGPPASWDNLFRIINQVVPITGFAGPGAWNDLDMLEVGNSGLTIDEQRTHFVFWAAAKSPLLISTDLTKISSDALAILKNKNILDLHGDSLGKSIGFGRRYTNDHDVWYGPLADGSTVAVVINLQNSSRSLTFSLPDVGFTSASAVDLWTGAHLGTLNTSYTKTVAAHGSLALRLSSGVAASAPSYTYYPASASNTILSGGASTRVVNGTVTVVGFVGNGATLTFHNVTGGTTGGSKLVSVDYINADFTMSNTACSNCRNAYVSVNGGTAVQVQFPISAQSWDIDYSGYVVELDGFVAGAANTVQFGNPSAWAPDFVRIGIAA